MRQLEESEFVSLYCDAHQRLWVLASAITADSSLAEDVLQEAAITALRKLEDFDPETSFVAWMSQIVRFTALNFLKIRNRRKTESLGVHSDTEPVTVNQSIAETSVSATGQLFSDQDDFDDEVVAAIKCLDPERRACLLLRSVHGLGYDEIAEIIGIPEGTAMSHVHRAKASMRQQLSSYRDRDDTSDQRDVHA